MDFHRVGLLDCGILLVKTGAQLGGGHPYRLLAVLRFAEARREHVVHVLRLVKRHVQLLDSLHLDVVKPIGKFLSLQLMNHLGI